VTSGRHRRDDAVGGVGQVGEAVGQAGAGEDEAAGVLVFGDAELGQQVQVVAQGLQFGVGAGGQVVAGVGERCVLHGESFRVVDARRACGRVMRPQGVGRFEAVFSQPGVFREGCSIPPPSRHRTDCVGSARCIGHKKPA